MIHLAYLSWLENLGEVGFVVALIWSIVTKPWTKSMWFVMKIWGSAILFKFMKDCVPGVLDVLTNYIFAITDREHLPFAIASVIIIGNICWRVHSIKLFFVVYQLCVVRNMLVDCITTTNIVNNTRVSTTVSTVLSYLSSCGQQLLKILTGPRMVEICTMIGIIIGGMALTFGMTFGMVHLLT